MKKEEDSKDIFLNGADIFPWHCKQRQELANFLNGGGKGDGEGVVGEKGDAETRTAMESLLR